MSPYEHALAACGAAIAATDRAILIGSPEALADCRRRVREAQEAAHRALAQAATQQAGEYDPTFDEGGD